MRSCGPSGASEIVLVGGPGGTCQALSVARIQLFLKPGACFFRLKLTKVVYHA